MDNRIKVLHIGDKFSMDGSATIHGVSRMFSWLIPGFDPTRYDVKLIGLRPRDGAADYLARQGVNVTSLGRGKFDFRTIGDIVRLVRQENSDIVHLHGYGAANFGRLAGALTGVKVIIHEHVVDPNIPKYQIGFDYALSRLVHYGIAVSETVKESMLRRRVVPEDKVEVIYYGTPLHDSKALPREQVASERAELGIPPDHTILGYIGRLSDQKGIPYLIDAVSILVNQGHKIRVVLLGDGESRDGLRSYAREKGISDHFTFLGYREQIQRYQSNFDIQVFPSLWEGTPLAMFEAMAMERAIVSTNVDGLGEILTHNHNALVVQPADGEALASAIEVLLLDPTQAEKLAAQAKIDSHQYDSTKTIERIQSIYDRLMSA